MTTSSSSLPVKQNIRILVLGNDWSRMNDLINFSEKLAACDEQFEIHFLLRKGSFLTRYPKLKNFKTLVSKAKEIASEGATVDDSLLKRAGAKLYGEARNLINRFIPRSSLAEIITYQYKRKLFLEEIRHGNKIASDFDVVLCFTDIAHECGIAYLKAFHDNQVPIIAIVLLNPAPEAVTMARKGNPVLEVSMRSPISTHLSRFLSQSNNLVYQNKTYLYHSPGALLALKSVGAYASKWFIRGTSYADIVCCDSQYDVDNNIKLGVPEKKLVNMGDYALDEHFYANQNKQQIRNKLAEQHGLDVNNHFIILALPQMAEHGYLDWDTHFEYINNIIAACQHEKTNLLISLHPKMNVKQYAYIEEKYNCHILSERLFEVLGVADTYLSKPSSTVRWGVMCDINVVLFDFWGFDLDNYQYLSSIDVVTKMENLQPTIEKRIKKKQNHQDVHQLLSRNELFDGQTMQRYAELVRNNVSH